MKTAFVSTLLASGLTAVSAHGYFESPIARQPGDAFKSACGEQAYNNLNSDINNNIQGLQQLTSTQSDYKAADCNLWMCKGLKYADNKDKVQSYTAGQSVDLYFQIVAPHSGSANVSIVDTASNSVIGDSLKTWDEYALTSKPMEDAWQNFTVTMPESLPNKCSTAGKCVIQMHWNSPEAEQTYQSCIDFTMGGSSQKTSTTQKTKASKKAKSSTKRCHARDLKA